MTFSFQKCSSEWLCFCLSSSINHSRVQHHHAALANLREETKLVLCSNLFQNKEEGICKILKRKGVISSVHCVYFMHCIRILLPTFFTVFSSTMHSTFIFRDSLFLVVQWDVFWNYTEILLLSPTIIYTFYFGKFIGVLDFLIIQLCANYF